MHAHVARLHGKLQIRQAGFQCLACGSHLQCFLEMRGLSMVEAGAPNVADLSGCQSRTSDVFPSGSKPHAALQKTSVESLARVFSTSLHTFCTCRCSPSRA